MFKEDPYETLKLWLEDEKQAGAPNPQQGVLSTSTMESIPHARVVAVREITDKGVLFFTQKTTRKVAEMRDNPFASFTFWFELLQREVILEGRVIALAAEENLHYWDGYPKEAQLRFYSYAPTSSQVINSKQQLEFLRKEITEQYQDKNIPLSPHYCGFRLIPSRIIFYAYRLDELSDVKEYTHDSNAWKSRTLSP